VDRRRALVVLGLDDEADLARLKQRFRMLARDLHPDRGGDRAAFQDLHAAYEVLRSSLTESPAVPPAPRVARGRPSRSDDATRAAQRLDDRPLGVTAQEFARRLTSAGAARSLSRAPGSRLNPLAASLALGSASVLAARLAPHRTPDGNCTVDIELTVRSRRARRALAALDLPAIDGASWARRRGDGSTVLSTQVGAADIELVARRTAAATVRMLDALDWPLEAWRAA
jgi:hypothetical protein